MSSEVNTPADLRTSPNTSENTREDMDPEDLCMTQSSILYLLQEATKLVAPPKQHSLGTAKLHDGTKETIVSHDSTRFEQKVQEVGTPEKQPSFTGAFSMLSCSPWEVMSLINLQCERLLHSGGTHEVEEDSQRHKTKMDTEDGDVAQEFPSAVSTSPESLRADTMEHAMELDVCCSVPHIIDPTDNLSIRHTSENGEGATVEAVEGLAELISKTTEDGLLSSRVMSDSRTDHCYLVETSVLPLDLTKKVEICEHAIENCEGVNKMGSVSSISDAAQSPEISSVDFTSSLVAEKYQDPCFSFNEGENAESECALMSETPPPPRTDLNNNLEDEALQEAEKTHTVVSAQARWGNQRRTPRKQAHPARSPDLNDPGLQGVTFSMHTELDHSTDQCRLLITSNYSKLCRRGRRSRSCRSRSLQSSQRTSSSEEESDSSSMCKKICASCCTRKTPLWRDAEDGTPLCNACGIRYKKYRVRCLQCWNIPRKEASSNSKCSKCGDLQVTSQSK